MKTKAKSFDAVAASRQWREETSRMLDAMPMAERIAFLEGLRASREVRRSQHARPVPEGKFEVAVSHPDNSP
jgi:hypothetical protein